MALIDELEQYEQAVALARVEPAQELDAYDHRDAKIRKMVVPQRLPHRQNRHRNFEIALGTRDRLTQAPLPRIVKIAPSAEPEREAAREQQAQQQAPAVQLGRESGKVIGID